MTEKLIEVMVKHGDYPKARLNKVLSEYNGNILAEAITRLFAEWTINLVIPETKNKYYEEKDKGDWQSWV